MKWLAYCQADQERHEAKLIGRGLLTAADVAVEFAQRCYMRESFEKYLDVVVVAVADDGTETVHEFTVDVDREPVFRARPRTWSASSRCSASRCRAWRSGRSWTGCTQRLVSRGRQSARW